MTANVYNDPQAATSIMAIEYKNMASTIIIPMMQRSGIKKIEVKRIVVASSVRMIPEVEYFGELPEKLKTFAVMAKYPIAEIMSLLGISTIDIEANEEEVSSLMATYEKLIKISEGAAAGNNDGGVELTGDMIKKAAETVNDPEQNAKSACAPTKACKRKSRKCTSK